MVDDAAAVTAQEYTTLATGGAGMERSADELAAPQCGRSPQACGRGSADGSKLAVVIVDPT